jgi:hypothetical protein
MVAAVRIDSIDLDARSERGSDSGITRTRRAILAEMRETIALRK